MIIAYVIIGMVSTLAALGLFELAARLADRYDKKMYRKRQFRRVMNNIRALNPREHNELIERASNVSFLRRQAD